MALMCFHASRLDARVDEDGKLILYDDQDTSLWNHELITRGSQYLQAGSHGKRLSKYHIEAAIAFWHTQKTESKEKWENILQLHNHLLQLQYSPVAALNRTYALYKANGREEALAEAEKLKLTEEPFYYILLGELYKGIDNNKAIENLNKALMLVKTENGKQTIRIKMDSVRQVRQ